MKNKFSKRLACIIICIVSLTTIVGAQATNIVVAFEKIAYSVLAGKSITVKPVIQGTKQKAQYSYSSEDKSIATVSNGEVKGISAGQTTIKCIVTIGKQQFECSYVLNVNQPVKSIKVDKKEYTIPQDTYFRESPFTVLPQNAKNKSLTFSSSKPSVADVSKDGKVFTRNSAGTTTITCKAKDGSGVKATFKVTVPKGAWFSCKKTITINDPEGISVYYAHTYDGNSLIKYGNTYCSNNCIEEKHVFLSEEEIVEYCKKQPFMFRSYTSGLQKTQLIPKKVGKSKFIVVSNGQKAIVDVTVSRSAVYETIKYEQYAKNEKKFKDLRFSIKGYPFRKEVDNDNRTILYFYVDSNAAKPAKIIIPSGIDTSKIDLKKVITIEGKFKKMVAFTTETGLSKKIPLFNAERIKLSNTEILNCR